MSAAPPRTTPELHYGSVRIFRRGCVFAAAAEGPIAGAMMLLDASEPAPARITNPSGPSRFLLIADHAGNRVPASLDALGLPEAELSRHIGIDIGVSGLGALLSRALDAPFVEQVYSRLVIDCNRDPDRPDAVPKVSDGTVIPGNAALSVEQRQARVAEIQAPYQHAIARMLAERDADGGQTVLVALHSFTPVMAGVARRWHCGILYDGGETRLALAALNRLRRESALVVGDNEPYAMQGTDHTVPRHAYAARRPYVEFEVRQDLIADAEGQAEWCDIIAAVLADALQDVDAGA